MEIYLDNSATTKPYEEVVEEMVKALTTEYGNPSSLHKKGIEVDRKFRWCTSICNFIRWMGRNSKVCGIMVWRPIWRKLGIY